jgi:hypothetical protein
MCEWPGVKPYPTLRIAERQRRRREDAVEAFFGGDASRRLLGLQAWRIKTIKKN